MNNDTTDLLRALDAVKQHLPHTVHDILRGQMTPNRQHEFADLLIDLGQLLHRDATTHETTQLNTTGDALAADTQPPPNTPDVNAREEKQS